MNKEMKSFEQKGNSIKGHKPIDIFLMIQTLAPVTITFLEPPKVRGNKRFQSNEKRCNDIKLTMLTTKKFLSTRIRSHQAN